MNFDFLNNIDPIFATFIMSMLPVAELRVAIPVAMANFDLPLWKILLAAILGSFVPAIVIIYFLGPISTWLRKWKTLDRFFTWLFDRTRHKFDEKYALWGNLALMFFVAIPLPGTGVWTGSLAAWLFGLNKKQALIYIAFGAILAGFLVALVFLGVFKIFDFILYE